jgi:cytochrome c2
MHASLRFGLALAVVGIAGGALALGIAQWQRETRAQVMAEGSTGGRTAAGEALIGRYGCGACHEIPRISNAVGRVGPSLRGFSERTHIAGVLANEPDALVRWLQHPQSVVPGTGMPDQAISHEEARDIAAYLYTVP